MIHQFGFYDSFSLSVPRRRRRPHRCCHAECGGSIYIGIRKLPRHRSLVRMYVGV